MFPWPGIFYPPCKKLLLLELTVVGNLVSHCCYGGSILGMNMFNNYLNNILQLKTLVNPTP